MGFKTPGSEDSSVVQNGNFRKSTAFINLWLPSNTESGKKKFGTIYLDDKKADESDIIEYLKANEANLKMLLNSMSYDFKLAAGATGKGFILPTDATPQATTG